MIEALAIIGILLGLLTGYCLRLAADITRDTREDQACDLEENQLP